MSKLDREGNAVEGLHYVENEVFNKKVVGLWNRVRPRMGEFTYFEPRDLALVKEIEHSSSYIHERAESAVGLEYAVMQGIHDAEWFGEGAAVTPMSKYDDLVNHLDAVVALRAGSEPMYLGLDVTSSGTYDIIERKLKQTADLLNEGRLAKVKYFVDDETGEHKQIAVPRVVIAATPEAVGGLMESMVERPKDVARDPIQLEVLEEALEQLQFGLEVLEKRGGPADTQETYHRLIDHLTRVYKKKSLSIPHEYRQAQGDVISDVLEHQRRLLAAA